MISKIERLEVSPTAALLGRCNALGITLLSLIASAERDPAPPVARSADQPVWVDPARLRRTMVSPIDSGSRVEIVRIELPPGREVKYDEQKHVSYDQHVIVLRGRLTLKAGARASELGPGDCVYLRMDAPLAFLNRRRTPCRYLVIISR